MNRYHLFKILKNFHSFLIPNLKSTFLILILILFGCSSTKRFTSNVNYEFNSSNTIRVLLDNDPIELTISINEAAVLSDDSKTLAKVNSGNKLNFRIESEKLKLTIGEMDFTAKVFFLMAPEETEIIKIDGKKFRGRIIICIVDSEIKVVNQIGLEDYIKGVMSKEMPVGKQTENYNALKAFSICARTYASIRINEKKDFFDIYPDTRDQVYGGVDGETVYTNKIVDETKGQILFYDNQPAIIFYHSTCGGQTENVANVFGKKNISYLCGVKDGDEPYCKISPRYEWNENYSELIIVDRLYKAKLIESMEFKLSDVKVKSRFNSGRVNELEIILKNASGLKKNILLKSNQIRSIIKSGDGKSILKSTLFDVIVDNQKNIVIKGRGNGHGVGLCQWGSIGQSKMRIDFHEILNHYFPGTILKNIYD